MTGVRLLVPATAGYADYEEDVSEEVDDVQVDVEGGEDVLLWAESVLVLPPHHELGVVHDIEGEDEGSDGSVAQHHPPAMENKTNWNSAEVTSHLF